MLQGMQKKAIQFGLCSVGYPFSFLSLLGPDFEIGGNFAVAIIHRGIGYLFLKIFLLRRRSTSASTSPSQVTEQSLPALSHASTVIPSNSIIRITRFVYISRFLFFFLSFKAWDCSCAEAHCWGSYGERSRCEEPRKPGRKVSALQNLQAQGAPQKRRVCMMHFSLKSLKCSFKTYRSNSHCLVFLVLFGSTAVMFVISVRCCVAVCACVFCFKCFVSFILCGVSFLLVFSCHVTISLSPGLQNYFPQHTQCYFVMSFLCNYFPSQSSCLLVSRT